MCGKEKLLQNAQSATSTIPTAMASSSSLEAEYQTIPLDDEKPECSNAIQYLYNACKSTFTQVKGSFSAEGLNMVRSLLDNIKPSDVGLNEALITEQFENAQFLKRIGGQLGKATPPISYIQIFECEYFLIGVFCLPPTAVIPLHNHPGMTVLSKLLYGSMHVKAYDWSEHPNLSRPDSSHCKLHFWDLLLLARYVAPGIVIDAYESTFDLAARLAKLVADKVMKAPCGSTILYPTSGGNMHSFRAVTSCAVLDILAPPYSEEEDRHCTYYKASLCSPQSGAFTKYKKKNTRQAYAWLEDIDHPVNFIVQPVSYEGPEIIH